MKAGKSITQFSKQSILVGDELFLVNQIQDDNSNNNYVSKNMRLSTLTDYILNKLATNVVEEEEYEVPPDEGNVFEFVNPGNNYVRNLSSGTWNFIIVGGGGHLLEHINTVNNYDNRGRLLNTNKYVEVVRGNSSPMLCGTFTLERTTSCRFHVGNTATCRLKNSTSSSYTATKLLEKLPQDEQGYRYISGGDPSWIAKGDFSTKLSEDNKSDVIVAVKAQNYYPNISPQNGLNLNTTDWGKWEYNKDNPYLENIQLNSESCKDCKGGTRSFNTQAHYVEQGKTVGTDYGRSGGISASYESSTDNCDVTTYYWKYYFTTKNTGGYIKVWKDESNG